MRTLRPILPFALAELLDLSLNTEFLTISRVPFSFKGFPRLKCG